jgi:hypothetical protein
VFGGSVPQVGLGRRIEVLLMRRPWDRWVSGLSEKEKYEITSWAFSYFMKSSLTVSDAIAEAVKKVKPEKLNKDGTLRFSKRDLLELQLRVKNML